MSCCLIPPKDFHACVQKMREFCLSKGFVEVHPQSALSILAACEDPRTVRDFEYGGKKSASRGKKPVGYNAAPPKSGANRGQASMMSFFGKKKYEKRR